MKYSRLLAVFSVAVSLFSSVSRGQDFAVQFNASASYINFGNNASLDVTSANSGGITLEMFIFMSDTGTPGGILTRFNSITGGYKILFRQDNSILFQTSLSTDDAVVTSTSAIIPGFWHHLACETDNKGNGRVFIDGIDMSMPVKNPIHLPLPTNANLLLGTDSASGKNFLNSKIDEFRISNIARYTDNFTPPLNPFLADSFTVGLWHFNEGSGSTAFDATGSGNNGTTVNDVIWLTGNFDSQNLNKPPFTPSIIAGSSTVTMDEPALFSASASDPQLNDISYTFEWGDASFSQTDFFASGDAATASHTWTNFGTYRVRVRAADTSNAISSWSDPFYIYVTSTSAGTQFYGPVVTCVLVRPNPFRSSSGQAITFYGDGIVPWNTTIRIYSLSGEPIKKLEQATCERLTWNGKTETGETVSPGIYIYTFESQKEKGAGKFTVIK